MVTTSFRLGVLLFAASLVLASCVPLNSVPATPLAPSPSAPSAGAAEAAIVEPALTRVSSERLVFAAAALAQPVPLGNGLYRVGSIDVSRNGAFSQTLDVVMDEPNTGWVTLPLRQDDLNFDGKPDLIITQPVGAKWGRLHAWVDDPATGRFITNTLTAELVQLRVGDFRLYPDKQEIIISNSLGMVPFENAYRTADGYLMPAFPPPGPADAGACPAKAPGMLLLREDGHDYCLLYPESFEASWPNAEEVVIGEPGSAGHGPLVFIRESQLGEKTVEQFADELLAPIAALTPTAGHDPLQVRRSRGMLAGEPAVILEGMPGQDIGRVVLVGHGGRLYEMMFVPADRADEDYTTMDALFAIVTSSFRFLPETMPDVGGQPGARAELIAACPPATANTQRLYNTDGRYCLTYPAEYKVEKPSKNETILVIGGLLDAANPRVHIRVSDAAGATAESVADRIVDDFEGFTLERSTMTVGGEPAVVLDQVPGQDMNRRVTFVHDKLLYELYIAPADATLGEVYQRLEALQEQVLGSFAFLPADATPASDCLTPTNETQLFEDAARGFCLLYPAGYTAETPSKNMVLIYSGSLQNANTPRLLIEIGDAGGRTARELADAAVAEIQAATPSLQIERAGGVTLGYQPAEWLEGMPGQDLSRQLIAVKDGRAYRLIFMPADPAQGDAYRQMEGLYDLVLRSFRFL